MGECSRCGTSAGTISKVMGFCADCIREHYAECWPRIKKAHDDARVYYDLPVDPPRAGDGIRCPLCSHQCKIPEGGTGYCGLRRVRKGKLVGGRSHEGNLSFYHDPLPTNCVGDFVCAGGGDCGYPQFSVSRGPEYGYRNLAVFYHACSFNCLYCQNYHFKEATHAPIRMTAQELVDAIDPRATCICYFGGDPAPQILHALKVSSLALSMGRNRIMRICWETNGAVGRPFLKRMVQMSLRSGGCIKFDLKAWHDTVHHALCGVSNRYTLENFRWLSRFVRERPDPPLLLAATLLVPGYVDEEEVRQIAAFVAGLDPDIPYRLLAFHPDFRMRDLPRTSREHALRCKRAALEAGLRRVEIGNFHLLSDAY